MSKYFISFISCCKPTSFSFDAGQPQSEKRKSTRKPAINPAPSDIGRADARPYSIGYAKNPDRWSVHDGSTTGNFGWDHQFTFWAFPIDKNNKRPPAAKAYSVGYKTGLPEGWRYKVSDNLSNGWRKWIRKFSFWAYPNNAQPGTIPYSVGFTKDRWGHRFRVTKGRSAGGGEWTHLFTFWAFPSKVNLEWTTE